MPLQKPYRFARNALLAASAVAAFLAFLPTGLGLASPPAARTVSDPEAVRLAEAVLERMGGREAWESTRYLKWRFGGKRLHHWDKWTGDVRIQADGTLVLMNLNTRDGRAWKDGTEIREDAELREALDRGYAWWVNDSYWLVMPYKLLDPGVRLTYGGDSALQNERPAKKITVTFDRVGLTPQNRYDVWVAEDSGLVEQWAFFREARDPDPVFIRPWAGWRKFGEILLATDHGRGEDWEIAAPAELPKRIFTSP